MALRIAIFAVSGSREKDRCVGICVGRFPEIPAPKFVTRENSRSQSINVLVAGSIIDNIIAQRLSNCYFLLSRFRLICQSKFPPYVDCFAMTARIKNLSKPRFVWIELANFVCVFIL